MEELEKAIDALVADRDNWRRIAEKALEELKKAVALLETVNGARHD